MEANLLEAPGEAVEGGDLALAAAVLRKDRKATAQLVALHADAVHDYVRRRLIPRTELVDDVVQDVFLAAWTHLNGYRGSSSLRSWLLGIARHKVEDHYRARLRDPAPIDGDDDSAPEQAGNWPSLDESLDRGRVERKTREILGLLPERYATVLLWRYWEKRSVQEMAESSGRSAKSIERLLARAREQFRRRWSGE